MIKIKTNLWGGIFTIVVSAIIWILMPFQIAQPNAAYATVIPPDYVPKVIVVVAALMGCVLIFQSLVLKQEKIVTVNLKDELRTLIYLGITLVYVLVLPIIGFIPATAILGVVTLAYIKEKKWLFYVITIALVCILYVVFEIYLGINLP